MSKEYSIEEAKRIFSKDRYAIDTTGIEILDVADGYAKCCFRVEEKHKNTRNSVMGGALFTLADFTFAVAANYNKPYATVTNVSQISFLRGASEGTIYAESKLLHNGRTSCTYQIDVKDSDGELFAIAVVHGIHVDK